MQSLETDVVIAGAGPAGATMALMLAGSGLKVMIVDKDRFPRNKICGDALSGKVLSILKRMPGDAWNRFLSNVPKTPAYGIRFISPGMYDWDFRFTTDDSTSSLGYICPRRTFDAFLVSELKRHDDIRLLEGETARSLEHDSDSVSLITDHYRIRGRILAGADGVHSIVRSTLTGAKRETDQLCTGIRAYYEGVTGFRGNGFIELFFIRELLPFYCWIFPEADGKCNVGLAMARRSISVQKVNLGEVLERITRTHPGIAPRFASARLSGKPEAHSLPLGMPPGPFSGDRILLLGDAAYLVDPFTGEGIGNAMASGEVAARVVNTCAGTGDYSARSLHAYDRQLMRRLGRGLRISALLNRLARNPSLFDFAVNGMKKNKAFRGLVLTFLYPGS